MVITTALFDLDRSKWTNYDRSIDHYKEHSKKVMSFRNEMVIYTTPDLKKHFEDSRRIHDPDLKKTKIITMDLNQVPFYDYLDRITEIMSSEKFIRDVRYSCIPNTNAPFDPYRPEANYPIYNIIQFAKTKFLKNTIENNYFNSNLHCWLDAGLHYLPDNLLNKTFGEKNKNELYDDKIHGFYIDPPTEKDLNKWDYYKSFNDVRIIGTWFGGSKTAMLTYSDICNKVIDDSIKEGAMSDDQNIYTIAYLENKEKFTLHDARPYGEKQWFAFLYHYFN